MLVENVMITCTWQRYNSQRTPENRLMIQTGAVIDKQEIQSLLERLKTACVVVLYRPGDETLNRCLSYLDYFSKVYVFDNTSEAAPAWFSGCQGICYRHRRRNLGIAAALNLLCAEALQDGAEWALTLDQDSLFSGSNFAEYVRAFNASCGLQNTAVFAAKHTPREKNAAPSSKPELCEIDAVMSSGNIISLPYWNASGRFNEDLFIDTVDHDFCLRLRRRGLKIRQFANRYILHQAGKRIACQGIGGAFRTEHAPERLYYILRNNLRLWKEYGREFPEFINGRKKHFFRKRLIWTLFYEKDKLLRLGYLFKGLRDYAAGRYGALNEHR